MIRKKWMAVSFVVAVTVSSLTGCGNSSQKSTTEDTTKTVQVTKVDGTTITADVGEYGSKQQEKSSGGGSHRQGGTPPEGAPSGAPDDTKKGDETPPESAPSGEPDNNQPSEGNVTENDNSESSNNNASSSDQKEHGNSDGKNGEPPAGKSGRGRFTANGESITFTITDSTEITQETQQGSEAASLEDIAKNSVLEVTLDSKNQATKVIIKNLQAGGGRMDDNGQTTNGTDVSAILEENSANDIKRSV